MPKVTLTEAVLHRGRRFEPGDELEVSDGDAERFTRKGWVADKVVEKPSAAPSSDPPTEQAPVSPRRPKRRRDRSE